MVSLTRVEELDMFKGFDEDQLKKIMEICRVEEFQQGQRLFREGEPAMDMWIVVEGGVELRFEMPDARASSNESMISSHHTDIPESQVFGWSCFIPPHKMRLSAYCISRRCQVIKINAVKLNILMADDTDIGFKIMGYLVQVVGYRFKQMQEEVVKFMGINMMNSW
ncbi:MAG: cyclic nucleotide-binding domain-containing protein [Proteobacteria bacterium]|nr:cyclic nucleotide-binding domain-containing protein [Desulfobacula sp.]MBU4129440.1 cyclic nucleotide-binding domain-containing protein [Pseudomonadota bacterium]